MATEKYPLHSVRLDDEVWKRLKAHPKSLNQILRQAFDLTGDLPPPGRQPLAERPFAGELLKPHQQKGSK